MKYKIIIFIVLFSLFSFYCNWYNEELRIEKNITITINNKSDYNVDCTIIYPYYEDDSNYNSYKNILYFISAHSSRSVNIEARWIENPVFGVIQDKEDSITIKGETTGSIDKSFLEVYKINEYTSSISMNISF